MVVRHWPRTAAHSTAALAWRAARRLAGRAYRRLVLCAANASGAAAAEYAFLIAFIAIVAAIGMVVLGSDLRLYFEGLGASLENASTPTPDPFS